MLTMTFTPHAAALCCRCAQSAYIADRNDIGHLLSGINAGCVTTIQNYDRIMAIARQWLVFNTFPETV